MQICIMKSIDGIVICSCGIIIFLISLFGNMPMSEELVQHVSAANVTLSISDKNITAENKTGINNNWIREKGNSF